MWAPAEGVGLEYLTLAYQGEDMFADGVVIGLADETPFRARYKIQCDRAWKTREVILELLEDPRRASNFWQTDRATGKQGKESQSPLSMAVLTSIFLPPRLRTHL
jgi:hypothetical protein